MVYPQNKIHAVVKNEWKTSLCTDLERSPSCSEKEKIALPSMSTEWGSLGVQEY